MPFSRTLPSLANIELNAALRSIGFRIRTTMPRRMSADIEVTLCSAVETALPHDYRLLGRVVAWLEAHHARVNVPRLGRIVRPSEATPVRAFWSAMGTWLRATDSRWRALEPLYRGRPIALGDAARNAIQMKRVGPDPRFDGSALRVHAKLLRSRAADIDTREELAARHSQYRKRLELGPNYRADVWVALEKNPRASPAEIARAVGCAYETARAVTEDFRVLERSRAVA